MFVKPSRFINVHRHFFLSLRTQERADRIPFRVQSCRALLISEVFTYPKWVGVERWSDRCLLVLRAHGSIQEYTNPSIAQIRALFTHNDFRLDTTTSLLFSPSFPPLPSLRRHRRCGHHSLSSSEVFHVFHQLMPLIWSNNTKVKLSSMTGIGLDIGTI